MEIKEYLFQLLLEKAYLYIERNCSWPRPGLRRESIASCLFYLHYVFSNSVNIGLYISLSLSIYIYIYLVDRTWWSRVVKMCSW